MESRRQSSRPIKRKKFYDEDEEAARVLKRRNYDYTEQSFSKQNFSTPSSSFVSNEIPQKSGRLISKQSSTASSKKLSNVLTNEKKTASKKKRNKTKKPESVAHKDIGRWKASDDIMLINNVEQVKDLKLVQQTVKFSCEFTVDEIASRWYNLLYDPLVSSLSKQAINGLPYEMTVHYHAKTLFSEEEEHVLGGIISSTPYSIETFRTLLQKNKSVFHFSRTADKVAEHWNMMKYYNLLSDQNPNTDKCFSDTEDEIRTAVALCNEKQSGKGEKVDELDAEKKIAQQRVRLEIRQVEEDLEHMNTVLRKNNLSLEDSDDKVIAILQGRLVRYLMSSKEISFGRATFDCQVDLDLSLDGPAFKVSRRHGHIRQKPNGDFFISNEGKRPLIVDSRTVLKGCKAKIQHNSVIEVASLRFVFYTTDQMRAMK